MRILVKAVPGQRTHCVEYLKKEIPDIEFFWDKTRNHMDTFLGALRHVGNDPCLHMEEDVILAQDFIPKVQAVINSKPDCMIQFFSMRKADLTVGSRWDSDFCMNQCTWFPAGYSRMVADFYPQWKDKEKHPTASDYMIKDWLKSRKEKYWIHVPSLVQHRAEKSLIGRRSTARQSLTFQN